MELKPLYTEKKNKNLGLKHVGFGYARCTPDTLLLYLLSVYNIIIKTPPPHTHYTRSRRAGITILCTIFFFFYLLYTLDGIKTYTKPTGRAARLFCRGRTHKSRIIFHKRSEISWCRSYMRRYYLLHYRNIVVFSYATHVSHNSRGCTTRNGSGVHRTRIYRCI